MEAEQESKEEPRLRRPVSKKDSIFRSLSAADGNNSSKKHIQFQFCEVNSCLHLHSFSNGLHNISGEMAIRRMSSRTNTSGLSRNADSALEAANGVAPKRGMVLPFTPLAMSFDSVSYYVDMPAV